MVSKAWREADMWIKGHKVSATQEEQILKTYCTSEAATTHRTVKFAKGTNLTLHALTTKGKQ